MRKHTRTGLKLGLGAVAIGLVVYLSPALWLGLVLARTQAALARGDWPGAGPGMSGHVLRVGGDGSETEWAVIHILASPRGVQSLQVKAQGQDIRMHLGNPFRLETGDRAAFVVRDPAFPETAQAWEALLGLPRAHQRWAAAFYLRPRWTRRTGAYPGIRFRGGRLWGSPGGRLAGVSWEGRIGRQRWRIESDLSGVPQAETWKDPGASVPPVAVETEVPALEMDRSLAAVLRLLVLQTQPVPVEPDGEYTEGGGRLILHGGDRVLHLSGTPYQMGVQHGFLLSESVRRGVDRIVYGIGLVYSISRGEWFLNAARDVIARQEPFVEARFFEEMRGISEGSGVSLEDVRIANFFPELWHCSGAALFGSATVDGKLLHARVLDYLTYAGLQDEAVLIAARPQGQAHFVNVAYAGLVGSVTGMNEHGIALGEMGGAGYGAWDGTPMALLMRGALEECATLEETLAYFRDRPRTCEYFYVFSSGSERTAVGVKATPDLLEVIWPGESHPILNEPVPDTVLLSGGSRYRQLASRVRGDHGRIDVPRLIEILRRPVSMGSNLHNVIFEVEDRVVHIAQAGRNEPACDRPYRRYGWAELFPEGR